jgi:predicted GTPase
VQSRKVKNIMRLGTTCRVMRAELSLRFLGQQTIEFRRRRFKRWMANFSADQHGAIRKVRVYESDAIYSAFWKTVEKLSALEKLVLIVDVHEGMAKARNRVMGFFSNKLNSVVGHKVEFEVLERDHSKPLSKQITLAI